MFGYWLICSINIGHIMCSVRSQSHAVCVIHSKNESMYSTAKMCMLGQKGVYIICPSTHTTSEQYTLPFLLSRFNELVI